MLVERVLVMTLTLIPATKGGEITQTSLRKSREIRGKVKFRTIRCVGSFTCKVKIKTKTLSIMVKGLNTSKGDQPSKDMVMEHITKSDERFKSLESTMLNLVTLMPQGTPGTLLSQT